ncbi:uncharacterized protein N7459_003346 [Penicillium hispanicum]|uniref:uncharacterized protein n=1 Tax=Penicillium hispanicum TaxID=1080232 RepID=UPI0025407CAB|nr:uncharacterized protein N7459_003346 [Penicillium hispanicum]KAJ5587581.1 hypothetical protein N7459_003346 [Penicillium hispanicum]
MCIYTYHHYPLCGHISHFTVNGCQEFTNQLRLVAGSDETASCNDAKVTHNLLPSQHANLCLQCEFEWSEAVINNHHTSLLPQSYRSIEGLDAKEPFIEFAARMTGVVRNEGASDPVSSCADDGQNDIFLDLAQEFDFENACECQYAPQLPQRAPIDHTTQTTSDDHSSLLYLNLTPHTDTSELVPLCMKPLDFECKDTGTFEPGMETRSKINLLDPLPSLEALYADLAKALKETSPETFLADSSMVSNVLSHADQSSQEETTGDSADEGEQSDATDDSLWRASMSDVSSIVFPPHTAYEWIPDLDLAGIAMARGLVDWQPMQDTPTHQSQCETADADADDESASQASFSSDQSDGGCPLEDTSSLGSYRPILHRRPTPFARDAPRPRFRRPDFDAVPEDEVEELILLRSGVATHY